MPTPLSSLLAPEKALIFRITHRANVPHILQHGVQCRNSTIINPNFVAIGHPDIIAKRRARAVTVGPGGTLADYVPFYFTPRTPMLLNIVTGYGVACHPRADIVVLVSSLDKLENATIPYVIADRNATLVNATFGGRALLAGLPWDDWRSSNFRRDPDNPEKIERYHAEALVHDCLPTACLRTIITYDETTRGIVVKDIQAAGVELSVHVQAGWYP